MIERTGGERRTETARLERVQRDRPMADRGVECECPDFCRIDHDND